VNRLQGGLIIMFLILGLLAPRPGYPLDASRHRQLVVVVTDSWNDFHARLYRFGQSGGGWLLAGKGVPAVVGEQGLAWDSSLPERNPGEPVKREGDRRAPAGLFPLSRAMGFAPISSAGVSLPYRAIAPGTHCVDDRESRYYNRIVSEQELPGKAGELWRSSERMWELPDLYRLLAVVDYNTIEPRPGAGSCIFLHIWRSSATATSGCTALAENDLAALMQWLKPEAGPALVQLPREVYRRVWRQWQLPPPQLLEEETRGVRKDLVDVRSVAPEVVVEMRYAGSDNFTGRAIYECDRCFLRTETAAKVARAERELRQRGLSLKMWDCYRPLATQRLLWSIVPDPRFVADPRKGSRHNRGNAVDVTLVDSAGRELEMPTKFDDFSPKAAHGETRLPAHVLENRRLLAETMERAGFRALATEWWHYDDADSSGDMLDVPFGELCR
jgi:D-alanyl-D-alanine dipeptidase